MYHTFTRVPVGSQAVSCITATCVGPNGVGATVSTAISIEVTLINVWEKDDSNDYVL